MNPAAAAANAARDAAHVFALNIDRGGNPGALTAANNQMLRLQELS